MKAGVALRFMKDEQYGIQRPKPNSASNVFLMPDRQFRGRDETYTIHLPEGGTFDLDIYCPPGRSTGSRAPTPRTQAHSRGWMHDQRSNREVGFSSTHEWRCAMMLMANRRVIDVEDQPRAIRVRREDGTWHDRTYDYRATFRNAKKLAIEVKPVEALGKSAALADVKSTRQVMYGFADHVMVLTERELTSDRAWNHQSILRARRGRREVDCSEMKHYLKTFFGAFNVFQIANAFPVFALAMNAIWCLIFDGVLQPADPDRRLEDFPFVTVNHAVLAGDDE